LLTPAAEARLDGTNGIPGTLAQVEQQDEGHARLDVTGIVFRFAHAPTIALKFCPGYKSKVTDLLLFVRVNSGDKILDCTDSLAGVGLPAGALMRVRVRDAMRTRIVKSGGCGKKCLARMLH
jgi:hypothetical protein